MSYTIRNFPVGAGAPYYTTGTGVRLRKLTAAPAPDLTAAGIRYTASTTGERLGTATGRLLVSLDKADRHWVELDTSHGVAYVRQDLATALRPVGQIPKDDGRALVQNLVLRSNAIARELLYQGEIIRRGNASASTKARYEALRARHVALRQKLVADRTLKFDTRPIPGFEKLTPAVAGIGVVPLLIWGAVAVATLVVVAGTWYVAYQSYHTDATAAELDLKECQSLTKLLETASPAQAKAVVQEVQRQLDKAHGDGYTQATTEAGTGPFSGVTDMLKWGGILYAVTKFL